jgi:hypothetical protein
MKNIFIQNKKEYIGKKKLILIIKEKILMMIPLNINLIFIIAILI